jgi:tRNA threonylcarbamoyladenosine biosynthesis protein TsaE
MKRILTKNIYNLEDLSLFTKEIESLIFNGGYSLFYVFGDMGAGKTTFIQNLLRYRTENSVSSPTFGILNIYDEKSGAKYLHFDLYRKNKISIEDLLEMGLDTIYESCNNYCFIEWPERIVNIEKTSEFFPFLNIFIKNKKYYREITLNI